MKLLHLSNIENRDSILKTGLLPSKISLESHLWSFQGSGLVGDKCVYTWDSEQGQSTDKYIRDMIYCKLFIHPRNDWGAEYYDNYEKINGIKMDNVKEEDHLDYRQFGTKLYGDSSVFDLFEIDIDEEDPLLLRNSWVHGQLKDDSPYASCFMLNEKYAHDDKILRISGSTIPPDMLKLVTTVKTRRYKNDTIGISYSKHL